MRRVAWTVGMGLAGLILGLKGQDTAADIWATALFVLWFASIGYSVASLFDQKQPTYQVVMYWATTLALVAPFCTLAVAATLLPTWPDYALRQQVSVGVFGALVGGLLGVVVGKLHLRRLRVRSGERLRP